MTTPSPTHLSDADYYAIEDALNASEKGRRFLSTYVHRNRGLETLRLLKSISKMYRTALGAPGVNAELLRDLSAMRKSISASRLKAFEYESDSERCSFLQSSLQEVEAGLIALIESVEEHAFPLPQRRLEAISPRPGIAENREGESEDRLFSELSSFFSAEPR
ncbi:MAG TPA: hypothetical protein VE986_06935 [Hyphomicrobiales bacterium]|nr:hypothetical protein [Hyphomicrobiales bacterium]